MSTETQKKLADALRAAVGGAFDIKFAQSALAEHNREEFELLAKEAFANYKPSPELCAVWAPKLAGALMTFIGHSGNRGYAGTVLRDYERAVRDERTAEVRKHTDSLSAVPVSSLAEAARLAKHCQCATCRRARLIDPQ